jgi:hypothetical protein
VSGANVPIQRLYSDSNGLTELQMPDHEKDEHIGCVLPHSERIALDAWAGSNDLSRSQAIRRAIRLLLAHADTPHLQQS